MKRDGVKNPFILKELAALGHTEYLCIADCGLPIQKGVEVVDVSVSAGVPGFMDVLKAVNVELVTESCILAEEIHEKNPQLNEDIKKTVGDVPYRYVPHEEFKRLVGQAKCVIRTGETSPYANILLVGGVNF